MRGSSSNGGNAGTAFAVLAVLWTAVFWIPLSSLVRFAAHSELYSHILLIPFASGYLAYLVRRRRELSPAGRSAGLAAAFAAVAAGALLTLGISVRLGVVMDPLDVMSLAVFAFITLIAASFALCFGSARLHDFAFPVFFLYFVVPMPTAWETAVAAFLQNQSAHASLALLRLTGTPICADGMILYMPGLTVEVAEECSGIHSSLVLFIAGILASWMFLRRPWSRVVLVGSILPLAILRNAVRVATISLLTIHVDPLIIRGPLHREGGPIFFALSLVPLLALLLILRKIENRNQTNPSDTQRGER